MKRFNLITISSITLSLILSLPIIYVFKNLFAKTEFEVLPKLVIEAMTNSFIMILVVGFITVFLASSLAWIISIYEFKFKNVYKVLLILPFAIAPYIMAQSYADMFSYTGFIPTILRTYFNINFTIDFLNFYGATYIYIISLFPYIYLFCTAFYSKYSSSYVENSRLLGVSGAKMYYKVGFFIARIPIIAGLSLVIMELISDYGVISYYGVLGFTTIFYKIWIGFNDFSSAIKLAAFLMLVIFIILYFEGRISKNRKYFLDTSSNYSAIKPNLKEKIFIYSYLSIVVLISFIMPVFELIYNNYYYFFEVIKPEYIYIVLSTILYCSIAAFVTVIIAFILVNYTTNSKGFLNAIIIRIATLGYSIPGVIIAIAVMVSFHDFDRFLKPFYRLLGYDKTLIISSSVFVLIFAYVVRFLTIAYNQILSNKNKYNPNIFEASRILGKSQLKTLFKVDFPLLKEGSILAFLLVFLEVLKELPITLLLKNYKLNTLTIEIHKYYSNEMIKESSVPALMIVIIGLIILSWVIILRRKENVKNN